MNSILFLGSFIFYFWGEKAYTIIVLISILVNYLTALGIHAIPAFRKGILILGIVLNLSLLVYFKYFNFFINDVLFPLGWSERLNMYDEIHLPLGISFFTFHGLTYIMDVYWKKFQPTSNLLNIGLYVLFFPQLIAGPIVRYLNIHQDIEKRQLSLDGLHHGVPLFIVGLAKKILLANTLGRIADSVFALPLVELHSVLLWFGIVVYALQIYYDFSGYSDMARGLARLFGFQFPENFNFPFSARSFNDFWKRWHISLTTFFREYVYVPMGGNQKGTLRTYFNLFFVFTLTGFWHGAAWNCLLWGIVTGLFIILEKAFLGEVIQKWKFLPANAYTLFVFLISLLVFRIEDVQILPEIFAKAFFIDSYSSGAYPISYFLTNDQILIFLVSILFAYPWHRKLMLNLSQFRGLRFKIIYQISLIALFLLTLSVMAASTYNPFIYFKF